LAYGNFNRLSRLRMPKFFSDARTTRAPFRFATMRQLRIDFLVAATAGGVYVGLL
jgi:hypothetical protein